MVKAKPSYGDTFIGVQIRLHASQADKRAIAEKTCPGASVSVEPVGKPAWGAAVVSASQEGSNRLGFFWDAGYQSARHCLAANGINTEWIE